MSAHFSSMPEHDGYRALAAFTAVRINCCWRAQPPIFFYGICWDAIGTNSRFSVGRDSADWIGRASDTVMDGLNRERLFQSPRNDPSSVFRYQCAEEELGKVVRQVLCEYLSLGLLA